MLILTIWTYHGLSGDASYTIVCLELPIPPLICTESVRRNFAVYYNHLIHEFAYQDIAADHQHQGLCCSYAQNHQNRIIFHCFWTISGSFVNQLITLIDYRLLSSRDWHSKMSCKNSLFLSSSTCTNSSTECLEDLMPWRCAIDHLCPPLLLNHEEEVVVNL